MKEILITSSVLILALLVLRLVFAKKVSRRLIYGAWVLVALRLLIPVQIGQLDFSVLTATKEVTQAIEQVSTRPVSGPTQQEVYKDIIVDYVEKDQTVFAPQVQEQIREETAQGSVTNEEIADKIQQKYPQQKIFAPQIQQQVQQQVTERVTAPTLGQIATAVWLVGMAVMAAWFAVLNLGHLRRLGKNREKLTCENPIPVYLSEKVSSPCLVGFMKPVIYLTPISTANQETRRHVLAHELTHYRHGDHIWSLVRCLCLCVYWFNPLVWVAAWASRRDCELACDEGALKRLGEAERIAYGKTLLAVVSHTATPSNLLKTATAMAETKKQLKERVNFIVKKPKISLIAVICMVLICAIVAGCVSAGPVEVGTSEPTQGATDPTQVPSTGPAGPDEMVTIYVVTKQKNYTKGEESFSASFRYDERARLTGIEMENKSEDYGSRVQTAEMMYDDYGNRIKQTYSDAYLDLDRKYDRTMSYLLTYTDGVLTRCDYPEEEQTASEAGFDVEYDEQGRLKLITSKNLDSEIQYNYYYNRWTGYTYDEEGRLLEETQCGLVYEHIEGGWLEDDQPLWKTRYDVRKACYKYDEDGKLIECFYKSAQSYDEVTPDNAAMLEYGAAGNQFFFHYDAEGNFAKATTDKDYVHDGSSASAYSDPDYTFDENGNLVRAQHDDNSWTEYTYMALDVTQADAEQARRLMHCISICPQYADSVWILDPLFWEIGPRYWYYPPCAQHTFSYLIPNPLWELFQ